MKDFYKGKSALITGGSSGIGLAIATELASYGCVVTLLARDEVKLGSAKASIETKHPHAHVETLSSDICDSDSLFALLDQFYTNHDVPDLVVNSAGFSHPGEFVDQSLDLFRQQMEINYLGTVYVLKSLVPRMIAKKSGHIVNISSAVGFLN
ncbi:MAG TPA: SDR family NAD(P)-dependent oxidoreductase, partial [Bellilinea sp.]|nr:SDR family NAD(P)-dependent oxidoreductase [Bellilinea sp.]